MIFSQFSQNINVTGNNFTADTINTEVYFHKNNNSILKKNKIYLTTNEGIKFSTIFNQTVEDNYMSNSVYVLSFYYINSSRFENNIIEKRNSNGVVIITIYGGDNYNQFINNTIGLDSVDADGFAMWTTASKGVTYNNFTRNTFKSSSSSTRYAINFSKSLATNNNIWLNHFETTKAISSASSTNSFCVVDYINGINDVCHYSWHYSFFRYS